MLELYKNIKERRNILGISQQELAERVGYSGKSMIAKIESGKVDLSLEKIQAFATALETTPSELMGSDGFVSRVRMYNDLITKKNNEKLKLDNAMELFSSLTLEQQEMIINVMKNMK